MNTWDLDERNKVSFDEEHSKLSISNGNRSVARHSLSSQSCRIPEDQELWQPETQKVDYLKFLICGVEQTQESGHSNTGSSKRIVNAKINPSSDLSKAINTISSSDNLSDCEMAIHVMTTAWLHSHGDVAVETALSKAPVIEGMVEVLFGSNQDEVLELTISMLADFVTRKEKNGQIILNADPELDIFTKLFKSSSLFLKAATLLYLVKPKAKHLISTEWVPLVLRVLEFGDQMQTLFDVRCSPQEAAYYLLDQLLTGFDEDRNWENARQVVALGGLSLLAKRMEIGDASEKSKASAIICCCIRADGSCRHYLAINLNKESVLSLVLEKNIDYNNHAFALLTELLCLQRTKGDPLKCSIYREEAVEAITAALESHANEKVQEQIARTLLILGGRFSHIGGPTIENWLLKEAGFDESLRGSFSGRDDAGDKVIHLDDEDSATEIWQRKTAVALLTSRNKKFVAALSESTARSIPCLARASLVTIAWMSSFLHCIVDENLQSAFCSILVPELIKSLHYDNALEERILASYSLFNLSKCSDFVSKISLLDKALMTNLGDLSRVTWTASELFMISTRSSRQRYPVLNRTASQSGRHVNIAFHNEF